MGGAGQDVDLRRGAASRAWRSAIWEERGTRPLRRPRRGMGVALTGTTVTDEDELESGSLSHLSPFCWERGGRGSALGVGGVGSSRRGEIPLEISGD